MLVTVRNLMPLTEIYYSAIVPRISDNYSTGINTVNRNIKSYCFENSFNFIPHYQFYRNPEKINYELFIEDKVHPTREGSTIIAKNIISVYRKYNNRSDIMDCDKTQQI